MSTESSARQYLSSLRRQVAGYRQQLSHEDELTQDAAALEGDQQMVWGPGGDFTNAVRRLMAAADVTEVQAQESVITSDEGEV